MSEATGGAVQKTYPNRKKKAKKPRLPALKSTLATLQQDPKDDNSQEVKSKPKSEVKRRRKKRQPSNSEINTSAQQLLRIEDSEESKVIKETEAPITGLQLMNKDQREVLKRNSITLLEKRSPKNPKAVFLCTVCNYHCDTYKVVVKHVNDKRHSTALMVEEETITLRLIPSPAVGQIQYLSLLLEDLASQYGLSEDNIKSRSNIVDMLNRCIGERLQGGLAVCVHDSKYCSMMSSEELEDNVEPSASLTPDMASHRRSKTIGESYWISMKPKKPE